MRRWWPVVLLLLVPLLPLWRAVFLGQAIGEFDHVHHMAPWNGPAAETPWDVLQADGVLQFYTWRDLVFESWGKGSLPFWNPYALAGTPLLGNSQSAALYPPHVLMGLLHVPTGLAMVLLAWAHLAWAGLGTYVLVRRLGGSKLGGAVAGMMFSLSPFMIAWVGLPSVITTVSWIPWVLAGVTSMFVLHPLHLLMTDPPYPADPKNIRATVVQEFARRSKYSRAFLGLTLSVAMLVLSGHLQFVAYGFVAAVLFGVCLAFSARRLIGSATVQTFRLGPDGTREEMPSDESSRDFRKLGPPTASIRNLCFAALLGLLLAAPQLLPVLNYSQFSHRRGSPSAEGYQAYVASAIKPFELGAVAHAPLVGMPTQFADLPADSGIPPISSYWPIHAKQGANFAEGAATIGPLALSLLFLAGWRRNGKALAPMAVVGGLAFLLAIGTILNAVLYYGVPGWSATGSPGRIVVLFVLAAMVIAGLAIDRLPPLPSSGPRRLLPLLLPLLAVIPFVLLANTYPSDGKTGPLLTALFSEALRDSAPGLLLSIVVAAIALASAYHLDRKASQAVVLAAPVVLFLLWGGLGLVRAGDPSFLAQNPLKPAQPFARVAVVNGPWDLLTEAPALAPPNTPAASRIHDLSGYDSLMHRYTVGLMKNIDGQDAAPPANGNMEFVKATADPAKLAAAGVSEVWSRVEMPQLGQPASADNGTFVYKITGPGRASTPAGPAEILSESSTSVKLRATGPGRLVLRDRNMPGWLPKIDGKHATLQGTTWLEVDLPPGTHQVEFNYVPPGFMLGIFVAAVAILVILAVFLSTRAWTRHNYLDEAPKDGPK